MGLDVSEEGRAHSAVFGGAARCSRHNLVFIEGLKAPLLLDPDCRNGVYDALPTRGMRAAARVFAAWGFSQAFLVNGSTWKPWSMVSQGLYFSVLGR
ncbi:hypothetical protein PCAR4_350104 [Paraburkholderia caribensis]|nr:hypothetical protein PCAR4_350104 [Paraburkholderia caribensis]